MPQSCGGLTIMALIGGMFGLWAPDLGPKWTYWRLFGAPRAARPDAVNLGPKPGCVMCGCVCLASGSRCDNPSNGPSASAYCACPLVIARDQQKCRNKKSSPQIFSTPAPLRGALDRLASASLGQEGDTQVANIRDLEAEIVQAAKAILFDTSGLRRWQGKQAPARERPLRPGRMPIGGFPAGGA